MKNAQRWISLCLIWVLLAGVAARAEDDMDTMGGMTLKTFVKKFGMGLTISYAEYRNAEEESEKVRYRAIKPPPVYTKDGARSIVSFAMGDVNFMAVTFENSDIMEFVRMEYMQGEFISSPDPNGESFYPLIMSILMTPELMADSAGDRVWGPLRMLTNALYVTSLMPNIAAENGEGEGVPVASDYTVTFEKSDTPDRYVQIFTYVGHDR